MKHVRARVRNEDFELYAARAVHWARLQILITTDLHLGKAETFQQNGLWLPPRAQLEDLMRLRDLVLELRPVKLLILGDLIHTAKGVTPELEATFAKWIQQVKTEVHVLIGNHDRHFIRTWPKAWSEVQLSESLEVEGFRFQHEPGHESETRTETDPARDAEPEPKPFTWMGHLHPMIKLEGGAERLRLPCFYLKKDEGFLPAFSSLAGGQNVHPKKGERVIASSLEEDWVGEI